MDIRPRSRARRLILCALTALLVSSGFASAQERDRSKIPDALKWNLADIYASDAAWRGAKEAFAAELPDAGTIQGPADVDRGLAGRRVWTACSPSTRSCPGSTSTRAWWPIRTPATVSAQGMRQEMTQLAAAFGAQAAFIEPEMLKAGKADGRPVPRGRAAAEDLRRSTSKTSLRREAHTLTDSEEKLLADAGPLAGRRRASTTSSRTRTSRIRP